MSRIWFILGGWVFYLFPASARGRAIRLSVVILLMLGVAIASLAWRNIDISLPGVFDLERGGSGPLGLKLGLDLRGGGHLIYQADTGTRFDVTFGDPITVVEVEDALNEVRFGEDEVAFEDFTIESRGPLSIRIKTDFIEDNDPRRTQFQDTMVAKLGTITSVRVTNIDEPTIEQMEVKYARTRARSVS